MTIAQSWRELAAAISERAPGLGDRFLVPAAAADIENCERRLGQPLPTELRASLAIFGGDPLIEVAVGQCTSDGIFRMLEWLSPRTIAAEWEGWEGNDFEVETYGPVRAQWWNPAWIPITLIGGATFHHCVDMAPASGGRAGQIIEIGKEPERIVIAPSLAELVAMLTADVRAGAWAIEDGAFNLVDEDGRTLGGFRSPYYPR